jgi:membrane-associated phospholipid phosphatase
MLKKIIEIDKYLFLKINQGSRNSFFDTVMPFIREPNFWSPLYLFLVVFVFINFGKKAFWWLLGGIITFTYTELISSHILKPLIARPRPCMDSEFSAKVRLLANYCGSNGSFTSSHAANHFGLAMFFFITLKHLAPTYSYLFFVWATLICFAQIYIGVHYPTDVIGGAALGMLIGWLTGNFYNTKKGLLKK